MPTRLALPIALLLVFFTSSIAQAFEFRLVRQPLPGEQTTVPGYPGTPSDPLAICPHPSPCPTLGDVVVYDLYLDTEGESGIVLFSMGIAFDPSAVTYRPDLSDANDDYPLYSPWITDAGKTIPRWLDPLSDPPALWPTPPPGLGQVNVDFYAEQGRETIATASNVWLATISFEVTGSGTTAISPGWDYGGNQFDAGACAGCFPPEIVAVWAPEPSTALLVGLGLAGVAMSRRRR